MHKNNFYLDTLNMVEVYKIVLYNKNLKIIGTDNTHKLYAIPNAEDE